MVKMCYCKCTVLSALGRTSQQYHYGKEIKEDGSDV
jgi:hypothetical protein